MIKKIVHVSDIHIRTYQLHDIYKKLFQNFIEYVTIDLHGHSHDEIRIVITGDVAHQKINISNEQVMLTSWFFNELSKIGKLIIIPGNHDFLENNQERLDSITPVVELLKNDNITYFKDSGVYEDDDVRWVVYSLFQNNKKPEFIPEKEYLYVGLFHGVIQGMSTDLGYTFEDAYDKLNFVGIDLLLCGDIHKRQRFKLPSGGDGIMIGSLIQQDFGESINQHGYGIYDVDKNEYKFHDLKNDYPYMNFTIKDIEDIRNETEVLVNLG